MMAHGTPLLLLHGFAASSAIWRPTMAALAGRRCVAFDWPGFGHAAHLERQAWFNAVVADFLGRP